MRSIYFYDIDGTLRVEFTNVEGIKLVKHLYYAYTEPLLSITQETIILEVKEYVKDGKVWCIAGTDERERLSVLNNMLFDVHVSQDIYDREFYERQIDIEAMMRDKLFRKLSEKLKTRVTFTTRPSYTPNYKTITASI